MKKILLAVLALMLGCGLAGAQTRLLGKVLLDDRTPNVEGISVTITKGDFTATTQTAYKDGYYDLLECPYGYEFNLSEAGTYELTYSYTNFETQTQQVTIEEGATQVIAPAVTLQVKETLNQYTFGGTIYYIRPNEEVINVADARVRCYSDYAGTQKVGEAVTDAEGNWTLAVECKANTTLFFDAEHPNIVVPNKASATAYTTSDPITVRINCQEKTPDLLGMETYKLRQSGTMDEPRVELSWTWPQELLEDYITEEGEGIYRIERIGVFRKVGNGEYTSVAELTPNLYELPVTSYADAPTGRDALGIGKTYSYYFDITYKFPAVGIVRVENTPQLTITLTSNLSEPDSVSLSLAANDPAMGTVTGAGKYEKGDMAVIQAQPNRGYRFKAWKKGEEVLATTPKHILTLTENTSLTAEFEARPPVSDSVTLTLEVNDAKMGTVAGAGRYGKGEDAVITATPNPGYRFKHWISGSVIHSTKAEYRFVINTDSTIKAVFERKIEYNGMIDYKARQVDSGVLLTWKWPQALVDNYLYAEDSGVYEISMVNIFRLDPGETSAGQVGTVRGEEHALPGTSFEDNNPRYPLEVDSTYTYYFEVVYAKPQNRSVFVKDEAKLTVRIMEEVPVPDSVTLTLEVDAAMGTVSGAGKYEKGETVTITATANAGYRFVAWMSGNDTVATTAEYRITLNSDSTLTAVFVAEEGTANQNREQAAWSAYAENGMLVLCGDAACRYEVYNMAGALVKRVQPYAEECRIAVNNSGLYIVRRISATGVSVKKAMVR